MKSIFDLDGNWTLTHAAGKQTVPATVPGDVHGALLRADAIPHPYYRDNEKEQHWIGESDWTYSRTFEVDEGLLSRGRILLCCDGLDTLATIKLNGKIVATTDNMFRRWEFDVTDNLRLGENTLTVRFASPMKYLRKQNRQHPLPGWGAAHKLEKAAWLRKEPCNFGWDWGPKLVTCGIWRNIRLEAFDAARLTDVAVEQRHGRGNVHLTVTSRIERTTPRSGPLSTDVVVQRNGNVVASGRATVARGKSTATLTVKNPELWWPNGLGDQPLYHVQVDLCRDGTPIDGRGERVGLRELKLERRPDRWGESFAFSCNGKTFFARGANWIPANAITSQLTYDDYWRLLTDAADVHMNMLRVWGGGIYEHDMFYELCDELGICVWQDFMFACSAYPSFDDAFMANVKAEAEDNVTRLRNHACIALWCGNNELEQGLVADEWRRGKMSWKDYKALFDRLLPSVVRRLDPERDYWPCSPHSPHGDRHNHENPTCGDAHLWGVWHGRRPFEWYRTCEHRFNSEFGFQSFPEPRTVASFTESEDRNVTAPVMEWHQRSSIGNTVIMQYMLDWFRMPKDFDMTLRLSQILQSLAIKYAVEHWRRSMPRGMGTLYWQLNDCWPVASWASIDSHGRWKALHYAARHFYAPVLLSAFEDARKGTVDVHVTNDQLTAFKGTVRWRLTTVDGDLLVEDAFRVVVPERRSKKVKRIELDEPIETFGADNLLVWMELDDGATTVSRNTAYFTRPKRMRLPAPRIRTSLRKVDPTFYELTLTAQQPALWTWVDVTDTDAVYSDNFVHLAPDQPQMLTIALPDAMTKGELQERLTVHSLVDTF